MHSPTTAPAIPNDAPRPRARWKGWLWLALSCALAWMASRLNEPEGPARDWRHAPVADPWPLPEFETLDQDGRPLRRSDLAGKVWIAELLSLNCSSCRPLSDRFHKLAERVGSDVHFLSFGLDLGDGSSALRSHVRHHPRVDAARWTLAAAEPDFSARLATGLGVARSRERFLTGLLELTPRLYLIDAHCRVVGAYDVDSAEALDRIADHARALSAARSSEEPGKGTMDKRLIIIALALSAIAAALVVRMIPRGPRQAPGSEASAQSSSEELPKLWDAPQFEFASQTGRALRHDELRGQVWIANFIFTQCTSICPTMTAKMVLLQRNLGAPQLRFVSFSVDPENDTPAVLKEYAEVWRPGETRWWLLATDAENLARVAKGFGVTVQKTDDVDDPILHSNRFFLVDPRGLIRGAYLSDDEEAIERLIDDTDRLLAQEFATSPIAQADLSGPELFQALGCVGCHNNPRLGPPLGGVLGHAVKLDDGSELVADRDYLRESILEPHARIVAGYRGTMPIYRGALSEVQLDRLLDYLSSLPPPAGAGEAPTLVYDPVCRMEITIFSDSPSMEHAGKRYWFCCEHCLERFKEEPSAFVDAKQ